MESIPSVSVIVAVYNAEKFIERSLASIVNQTFTDWECLLIDDGSTDGSGSICDGYAQRDARFRVIHKPNGGVGSARKCGIDNARGAYTIHVDPDDWIEPDMLSALFAYAVETGADMLMCDFFINTGLEQKYSSQRPSSLDSASVQQDICSRLWGGPINKLVKLDCYIKYGISYPCDLKYGEDLITFVRLLSNDISVSYLPRAFYHYDKSVNNNSLTNAFTKERYYNQEQAVMEIMKYVDGRNRNAMVRSRYQSCAYMSLKLGIYGKNEYRNKFHLLQSVDILSNDCLNKHTNLVVWCSFHFSYRLAVFGAKAINKYQVLKNKLIEIWNLLRAVISLKRFNYSR